MVKNLGQTCLLYLFEMIWNIMLFLMFWHEKDVEYAFQPAHPFMVVRLKSVHYVDKELNKFILIIVHPMRIEEWFINLYCK